MSADGRLIGTGSFKVDRDKALDKLMRFQLPDARMYALPWVQAAVARGAENIYLRSSPSGFELAFDGKRLSPDDLKDPYRHLFEEENEPVPGLRELGVGFLAALRLKPSRISMTFEHDGAEFVLHVDSPKSERLELQSGKPLKEQRAAFSPKVVNSIFVALPAPHQAEAGHLASRTRHCPAKLHWIRLSEPYAAPPAPARLKRPVTGRGITGELRLGRIPAATGSVAFVIKGVTIDVQHFVLAGAQAEGHVRCDDLRVSLSESGLVRDERYAEAAAALEKASLELLSDAAMQAAKLARPAAKALREHGLSSSWMSWQAGSIGESLRSVLTPDPSASEPMTLDAVSAVGDMSYFAAVLRQAALAHRVDMLRGQGKASPAIWDSVLLFDSAGAPLTLRALETQRRWLHQIPTVEGAQPSAESLSAAWVVRRCDRDFLEAFFPDAVRAYRPYWTGELPDTRPLLRETNLLARQPVQDGLVSGEIGLSLSPHTADSRILWLTEKRSVGRGRWRLGGLRLEASVHHPNITEVPSDAGASSEAAQVLSAIMRAADELYAKLASEYDAADASPIQALRREHLLDYLRSGWNADARRSSGPSWLDALALLRSTDGSYLSPADLRAALSKGRKVLLSASVHPPKLQALAAGYPDHVSDLFARDKDVDIARPKTASGKTEQSRARRLPLDSFSPPAPDPSDLPPESAASGIDDLVRDPVQEAARWFARVRQGVDIGVPEGAERRLSLRRGRGTALLNESDGRWWVDSAHPLYRVLEDSGGAVHRLPYLVSILYTAVNRKFADVPDSADVRFTLALAKVAAEGYE